MLCVGTDFALGGFDLVADPRRREADACPPARKRARAHRTGRPADWRLCGNALELTGRGGQRLLALSERACASLSTAQKAIIERSATLLPLRVPTIELAGGSVRCMLAGIHLAGGLLCRRRPWRAGSRAGMGGVALLWALFLC